MSQEWLVTRIEMGAMEDGSMILSDRQNCGMVIFDCDGVLVDTIPLADAACVRFFNNTGLELSIADYRAISSGRDLRAICEYCSDLAGVPFDADMPEQVRGEIVGALKGNVTAIPGAVDTVRRLHGNGQKLCVASSGAVSKMEMTLGAVGLLPVFDGLLFSAQDCGRGKPCPDVFLTAAQVMNVDVGRCVVVEDTLEGVQAAIAAGMQVFGFVRDAFAPCDEMERAGAQLFDDMAALEGVIYSLNGRF